MAVVVGDGFLARLSACRAKPEAPPAAFDELRFAFYGRMSTSTFQDVQTSRAWQRAVSEELIDGIGPVLVEYFDVGVSRRWSWQDRPEAAALLAAAADPAKDGEVRRYLLAGLVVCGLCGRRMDGHWVHGRAGYRCRHGFTSAKRRSDGAPRNLYVREDHLLEALPYLLVRTAGPVEEGVGEELVDQVREQRLQIYYDDQGIEVRPAPLTSEIVEPARRPVQSALALDWFADAKVAVI